MTSQITATANQIIPVIVPPTVSVPSPAAMVISFAAMSRQCQIRTFSNRTLMIALATRPVR